VRATILLSITGFLVSLQGCGPSGTDSSRGETISTEAFTQAYIELRMEALYTSRQGEISLHARDSILETLGLKPEDLLDFVEVWGENSEVMDEVWQVVDSVIRAKRVAASNDDYEEGERTGGDSNRGQERPGGGGGRP
jgi:hypothetical protein